MKMEERRDTPAPPAAFDVVTDTQVASTPHVALERAG
jgi:hypothetical protein